MERKFQNYLLDLKAQGKTILLKSYFIEEKLAIMCQLFEKVKSLKKELRGIKTSYRTNFEVIA